tara:strand:+ start:114 stop:818 length:705 start_codon:yes stop_codon:yes gene_type:complete
MALPKLNTATYELDLPSTGEKLKYRPWLVKEQKILLMAQEGENEKEIESAFANIISECTFGSIDPYENPMFDLEYIFLHLRSKSVGEKITINVLCPDDEKTRVDVNIDLAEVGIQMKEDHTNVIQLTDKISMHMRYPTLSDTKGLEDKQQTAQIFQTIKNCVHEIHDGDTIHNKVDMSDKDLDEFIDSMSQENFDKLSNFFDTMPKLQHIVKVKNPKTKKVSEVPIEGLQSFFV